MENSPEKKPRHRNITLSDNDCSLLRAMSPRGQLSDGIRIALKESTRYRKEKEALKKIHQDQDGY